MFKSLALAAAIGMAAFIAAPAAANHQGIQCGPSSDMVSQLLNQFGESPLPFSFEETNRVLYFFANTETETWTVLRVTGNVACMVASGKGLGGAIEIQNLDTPA